MRYNVIAVSGGWVVWRDKGGPISFHKTRADALDVVRQLERNRRSELLGPEYDPSKPSRRWPA